MPASKIVLFFFGACVWAQNGPVVWVAPSLQWIRESDQPVANIQAKLWAAKGEYESFQIVIRAPAGNDLTNAEVTLSDLTSSDHHKISTANLSLFQEHYVTVRSGSPDWHKTNRPLGPGRYPDALVPLTRKLRIRAGTNQPVWVDVSVPDNAAAGQYSGTYTVRCDQGKIAGQISIRVWDFALPARPKLQSAFLVWQNDRADVGRTLLENKISPLFTSAETIRKLVSKSGLEIAGLPFWSGADVSHCSMGMPPSASAVRSAIARLPRGLELLDYSADEVGSCRGLYPLIRAWGNVLHQAGVKNLVTMAPVPELMDDGEGQGRSSVDIWAVLPEVYDRNVDAIHRAKAKGDSVWSYTTLVQDAYSPKWEIDFAPINFRIQPGFLSQSLGLTGILYWRVDLWPPDFWNTADTTGRFNSNNFPGEGMLVYPGGPAGVSGSLASIRLKWIRDGIEDFDYVSLLRQLGYGSWAEGIVKSAAFNWSEWTQDPTVLETVRQKLGEKLDGLAARGSATGTRPSDAR